MQNENIKIRRAIISTSEKKKICLLAKILTEYNVEIVSTAGTASLLKANDFYVREVSELTNFPEMMEGRVKTIHPLIHGGILFRRTNSNDIKDVKKHEINEINLVVVNLYPFRKKVLKRFSFAECVENIDIGGSALIRAAAKNFENVCVIVDPKDYPSLIKELGQNKGCVSKEFSKAMAVKAFRVISDYDNDIHFWLSGKFGEEGKFPLIPKRETKLRYGENPHQKASLCVFDQPSPAIAGAKKIQGKELSYNNYVDADCAFKIISEFNENDSFVCVIVKHKCPCGVAKAPSMREAYVRANQSDPASSFGGIIALNSTLDKETSIEIIKTFVEVIIAPNITKEAKQILKVKKNVRVLQTSGLIRHVKGQKIKKEISGGYLLQDTDSLSLNNKKMLNVTIKKPTKKHLHDLIFAWKIVKHVNSNAIVIVKDGQTIGIGAGQTSRVGSVKLAVEKVKTLERSGKKLRSAVVASDAFFPFKDGITELVPLGIKAIIQPGGSQRDYEVIGEANKNGISMIFTGTRHFSH